MVVTSGKPFLAVDWGTTNRRVYRLESGVVAATERDDHGVTVVTDFAHEVSAIRARFGDLPMLLAGMVGSSIGWQTTPYVKAPAGIAEIAGQLHYIDDRTAIIPGVSLLAEGRLDIMRGEEVQLVGAVVGGLVPANSLLAQPGTHCKWAEMVDGHLASFTTAMTGELFGLLRRHGLLAAQLQAKVRVNPAFLDGVEEAKRRDLSASLFGIRAAKILGKRDDRDAAAFASGLLIGSDVVVRIADSRHDLVHILAGPELGSLYAAAIEANGRAARIVDSHAAFVAGIIAIGDAIP